jgi:uncharacterized membrane protein YtjA (UPF0391 family)
MLGLIVTLLVIALVAAFFGFGILAGAAAFTAKVVFFIFLVLFALALINVSIGHGPYV